MVLAFNARLSTRDVDAVFQPTALMRDLSAKVAAEIGLPENWLNDGVKGFQSANPALTSEALPQFSHLRLLRPTADYLLAMKCLAARAEDHPVHSVHSPAGAASLPDLIAASVSVASFFTSSGMLV